MVLAIHLLGSDLKLEDLALVLYFILIQFFWPLLPTHRLRKQKSSRHHFRSAQLNLCPCPSVAGLERPFPLVVSLALLVICFKVSKH